MRLWAIIVLFGITWAYAQEAPRPNAAQISQQLMENDLRNYRTAVAQLSEQNQKLQDEIAELKKQCPTK